jgi:hypothetical protein
LWQNVSTVLGYLMIRHHIYAMPAMVWQAMVVVIIMTPMAPPTGMVDGRQGLKRNREMGPVHDPTIVGTHESKP